MRKGQIGFNLYLSKKQKDEFQKKCGDLPMARVLRRLIQGFIDGTIKLEELKGQ